MRLLRKIAEMLAFIILDIYYYFFPEPELEGGGYNREEFDANERAREPFVKQLLDKNSRAIIINKGDHSITVLPLQGWLSLDYRAYFHIYIRAYDCYNRRVELEYLITEDSRLIMRCLEPPSGKLRFNVAGFGVTDEFHLGGPITSCVGAGMVLGKA